MSNASSDAKGSLHNTSLTSDEIIKHSSPLSRLKRLRKQPRVSSPLLTIFITIVIFIASQLLAGTIVGAIAVLNGANSSNLSEVLTNSTSYQFFTILLAEALAVGLVLLVLKSYKLKPAAIGLVRPRWSDAGRALAAFAIFFVLAVVAIAIFNVLAPNVNLDQPQDIGFNNVSSSSPELLLVFISLAILPPIGEEILMRGYLYTGLRSRLKFVPAMLIVSLLFGAAHLQLDSGNPLVWSAAIDTFVLSLVLVYLREKTGSLFPGILVHALNNTVAFIVVFHAQIF